MSALRTVVVALCFVALAVVSRPVRADAVDDAFAQGTEAASRNDWERAAESFESASALLPQRSAVISYNLGTAYAHLGDLGRATYHLRRASDWRAGPTAEVLEASRSNLAAVRRRAELDATSSGAMIDRPETTWDLLVDAIRAPWVAWLSLVSGVGFCIALYVHRRWLRAQPRRAGASRALLIVLALLYAIAGGLHGWSVRAASAQPEAIVLGASVDAREGPGQHRSVEFTLQGGAQVRVLDRSPGWQRVKLPGGLTGWVPETSVARIDAVRAAPPATGLRPGASTVGKRGDA
ncbi:MAG: SH3 domain-containing protein [Nannocystaceae bacterium]|nr:SH3 domain-containing protein [bacterium]